jgi:hypothetical protein
MRHHEKKILKAYYDAIVEGRMAFNIRRQDDEERVDSWGGIIPHYRKIKFKEGDTITLKEWIATDADGNGEYTGREINATIGYVTNFAQQPDYVVFSLLNITHTNKESYE